MAVLVVLRADGDPKQLEQYAAENQDAMQRIVDSAKEHGVIAHRFYGSDEGQIMVVDEWPDRESFQAFFEQTQDRIRPLMQGGGMTSQPDVSFWKVLETHDRIGWGA